MRIARRTPLVPFLLLLPLSTLVHGQPPREPIGPIAVDARIAIPRFAEDTAVAAALGVSSVNLPSRGLGLAGGVHVYPFRTAGVAFGVGGEILLSRGSNTLDPDDEDALAGPTVVTRFTAVSPQVSINFGTGRGWSYLSGGIGLAGFRTQLEDQPVSDAPGRLRTISYGGGARWFARRHVAFAFDLRFYRIPAQAPAAGRPAYAAQRMMVLSAGVSFR